MRLAVHTQNDFTEVTPIFHASVRSRRLLKRIHCVNDRFGLATLEKSAELAKLLARALGCAENFQVVPEDPPEICRRPRAADRSAGEESPAASQGSQAFGPTVAANAIDDQINTAFVREAPHLFGDIHIPMIDAMLAAQCSCLRELFVAGRGNEDTSSDCGGNLKRGRRDSSADPDNQNSFAGSDFRLGNQ
jgi:hypothetical protein